MDLQISLLDLSLNQINPFSRSLTGSLLLVSKSSFERARTERLDSVRREGRESCPREGRREFGARAKEILLVHSRSAEVKKRKMAELTSLSHTATFLHQVSDLKRLIDQINDEIETEIKKTRELETEILRVPDNEQQAIQERENWKKELIQKEVQHMDLEAVTAASKESIAEAEENLNLTTKRREELYCKIQDERDSFIETCKIFQLHQQEADEDETVLKLVERKCNLLTEVAAFRKKDEASKVADGVLSQNKVDKLRELQTVNEGLQAGVDEKNAHNQKLLKRIESLDEALLTVQANENIARLQAELDSFTEEKQNLEDGVLTLQQQLPLLLNHEQKLGGLLKEQQQVLGNLERKLQEVKTLQEAYENDARDACELSQLPQPQKCQVNFERPGHTHELHGSWERSKIQGGKRHRRR